MFFRILILILSGLVANPGWTMSVLGNGSLLVSVIHIYSTLFKLIMTGLLCGQSCVL